MSLTSRRHDAAAVTMLKQRLQSLDEHCLNDLVAGLRAMGEGDLTVEVAAVTTPIEDARAGGEIGELVTLFNSMLAKAQAALEAYDAVRRELQAALGDRSCLGPLQDRLTSLSDHCLVSLGDGLEAMTRGDLTRAAEPVTEPIPADGGRWIGSLGETFNTMLGRAQGGLGAYNTMREQLAAMIAEIGSTSTAVAGASEQISSTAAQTGAAVQEIARPPSTSPPAPSAR